MKTLENKGNLYILLAAIFWSTGGILIKYIPWNAMTINGIRSALAIIFFIIIRRGFHIKCNKTIILAALCLSLNTTLYVFANKLTTAANAIVLQYMSPIFVLVFSCIKERKLPTKRQTMIVGMAFIGMVLFFFDRLDAGRFLGNMLAIIAGVCFAGVFFVNSLPDASSDDSSMIGFLISFLIAIPFYRAEYMSFQISAVVAIIVLGFVQIGLAYYMFGKGSKLTNPVSSSLISLLEAVLNPIWVLLFYGEQPGVWSIVGGMLILGAIAWNIYAKN